MTDDAVLFAAALARPWEDTPRLALADWFDDHGGEELAWALRTVPGIIPFLSDLARWDRIPATPTQELKDGRFVNRWESQYWAELVNRYRDQFPEPPGAPKEYAPDAGWATPGGSDGLGPGGFLTEWQRRRARQITDLRDRFACVASEWSSKPVALPQGNDPATVEARAILLHELVIRGHNPRTIPGHEKAWAELSRRGHPLFGLPPEWLGIEQLARQFLTRYGSTDPLGPFPVWSGPPRLPDSGLVLCHVTGAAEPEPDSPAWAAVRAWRVHSNGMLEARVLTLPGPFSGAEEWVGWFESLPLRSVVSQGMQRGSVSRLTPQQAFRDLFSAAQSGGAYGGALGAAYGRLHAWESLGWLVGAEPDASCTEVADLCGRCRWFAHDTDWFYHVAWDLGLVCVRPDGRTVAVLAATDTD